MNTLMVCSKCGEELPETAFYTDSRKEGRLRSVCKSCWAIRKKAYREAHKEEISAKDKLYYIANREKINKRISQWRKDNHPKLMEQQMARRKRGKEVLANLKKPCAKCGETRPWVIHFHHIDPAEKAFDIDLEAVIYKNDDIIKAELDKCTCLCANCHIEFHHFYGKIPEKPRAAFEKYLGGKKYETITRPSRN